MDKSRHYLRKYYIFSPFLRIFHWMMASSILVLFFTGLYIMTPVSGGPGHEPSFTDWRLSMDLIRNIHFFFGFVLAASFILRIYGWIINRGDRLLPKFWTSRFMEDMWEVILYYLLIKDTHKPCLRNPLARLSYLVLYIAVFFEMLTGFGMYYMPNPTGFPAHIFGWQIPLFTEMYMHWAHHLLAWFIVLFAIGHIYMVIRADLMEREGEVSSMFSGSKTLAHRPADLDDLRDRSGKIARN